MAAEVPTMTPAASPSAEPPSSDTPDYLSWVLLREAAASDDEAARTEAAVVIYVKSEKASLHAEQNAEFLAGGGFEVVMALARRATATLGTDAWTAADGFALHHAGKCLGNLLAARSATPAAARDAFGCNKDNMAVLAQAIAGCDDGDGLAEFVRAVYHAMESDDAKQVALDTPGLVDALLTRATPTCGLPAGAENDGVLALVQKVAVTALSRFVFGSSDVIKRVIPPSPLDLVAPMCALVRDGASVTTEVRELALQLLHELAMRTDVRVEDKTSGDDDTQGAGGSDLIGVVARALESAGVLRQGGVPAEAPAADGAASLAAAGALTAQMRTWLSSISDFHRMTDMKSGVPQAVGAGSEAESGTAADRDAAATLWRLAPSAAAATRDPPAVAADESTLTHEFWYERSAAGEDVVVWTRMGARFADVTVSRLIEFATAHAANMQVVSTVFRFWRRQDTLSGLVGAGGTPLLTELLNSSKWDTVLIGLSTLLSVLGESDAVPDEQVRATQALLDASGGDLRWLLTPVMPGVALRFTDVATKSDVARAEALAAPPPPPPATGSGVEAATATAPSVNIVVGTERLTEHFAQLLRCLLRGAGASIAAEALLRLEPEDDASGVDTVVTALLSNATEIVERRSTHKTAASGDDSSAARAAVSGMHLSSERHVAGQLETFADIIRGLASTDATATALANSDHAVRALVGLIQSYHATLARAGLDALLAVLNLDIGAERSRSVAATCTEVVISVAQRGERDGGAAADGDGRALGELAGECLVRLYGFDPLAAAWVDRHDKGRGSGDSMPASTPAEITAAGSSAAAYDAPEDVDGSADASGYDAPADLADGAGGVSGAATSAGAGAGAGAGADNTSAGRSNDASVAYEAFSDDEGDELQPAGSDGYCEPYDVFEELSKGDSSTAAAAAAAASDGAGSGAGIGGDGARDTAQRVWGSTIRFAGSPKEASPDGDTVSKAGEAASSAADADSDDKGKGSDTQGGSGTTTAAATDGGSAGASKAGSGAAADAVSTADDDAAEGATADDDDEAEEEPPAREWNSEWLVLQARHAATVGVDDRAAALEAMRSFVSDFAVAACNVSETIAAQMGLPADRKTIVPVDVGGVAGGTKYLHRGMFLKFTEHQPELYQSYAQAMKVAEHEFKSLELLQGTMTPGLHCPLQVLVDVLGFRVCVSAALPIGGDTLVYGSQDAAARVSLSEAAMNGMLARVGRALNLAAHYVGRGARRYLVYGPADLEGHLGRDGRYYVVDSSRLLPPLPPVRGLRGSHLTRLMRPELVSRHPAPLSSDAFTGFGAQDAIEHNTEARRAASSLYHQTIPSMAHLLTATSDDLQLSDARWIRDAMRGKGINAHLLGLLRSQVRRPLPRATLLTMMVARVAKDDARSVMRAAATDTAAAYATKALRGARFAAILRRAVVAAAMTALVSHLNALLGPNSEALWKHPGGLKRRITSKFARALSPDEVRPETDLRGYVQSRVILLQMLSRSLGIRLKEGMTESLGESWNADFDVSQYVAGLDDDDGSGASAIGSNSGGDVVTLDQSHIAKLEPRVRTPAIHDDLLRYLRTRVEETSDGTQFASEFTRFTYGMFKKLCGAATGRVGTEYMLCLKAIAVGLPATDGPSVVSVWSEYRDAEERSHGPWTIEGLMALRNMVGGYSRQGQYATAVAMLRRFTTWLCRVSPAYGALATALGQIGTYTMIQGGYEKVLTGMRAFGRASDLTTRSVSASPNHVQQLKLLGWVGQVVMALATPDNPHCAEILMAMDSAAEAVLGEAHAMRVGILFAGARTFNAAGAADVAKAWVERAWEMQQVVFKDRIEAGGGVLQAVDVLVLNGLLANRRGEPEAGLAYLQRAVEALEAGLADVSVSGGGAKDDEPVFPVELSNFTYVPMLFGELAVALNSSGLFDPAVEAMQRGFHCVDTHFADDPGAPGAKQSLGAYWAGVLPAED